jgi:hypothetical protein
VARRAGGPAGEAAPLPPGGGAFAIPSLALYVSRLSRAGARYEALARFGS